MREILFRGKRVDNGEWAEGLLGSKRTIIAESPLGNIDEVVVIPESVGQYAGLIDNNGKRIFEGDIVRGNNFWHEKQKIYQVAFDDGGFYLVNDSGTMWHHEHIEDIEVIGNIYDNPELMDAQY